MNIQAIQNKIDSDADFRSFIRAQAGERGSTHPIRLVAGSGSPRWDGEGFYYTTLSGKTRVHSPKAYKWPTVYHCSTRKLDVPILWLLARRPSLRRAEIEVAA